MQLNLVARTPVQRNAMTVYRPSRGKVAGGPTHFQSAAGSCRPHSSMSHRVSDVAENRLATLGVARTWRPATPGIKFQLSSPRLLPLESQISQIRHGAKRQKHRTTYWCNATARMVAPNSWTLDTCTNGSYPGYQLRLFDPVSTQQLL